MSVRFRWSKVGTVIRREYLSRVRTKAFWISTLLVPVLMLVFFLGPSLLMRKSGGDYRVVALTANIELAAQIQTELERLTSRGDSGEGRITIRLEPRTPEADASAQREALKRDVLAKKIDAVIILPANIFASGDVEYLSTNVSALRLMDRLDDAVNSAVIHTRLASAGVAGDRIAALTERLKLKSIKIGKEGAENAESIGQSILLSYVFAFLIFFTVMIYGMYVMRGVLEEKSSRIIEVIVANLSAFELMAGKILGVGAVGLTQYAIWVVLAMNLAVPGLAAMGGGSATLLTSPLLLVFFVIFFVLGYFLYATLYAALGAAFNSEEEAQQMQAVAGWMMAVPFLFFLPVLNNPDSTLSVVLSLIPFFSPMLFFMRMTVQTPPVWQIVLCVGLLLASIVLVTRIAAAIYRVGILSYGKRPTFREALRWVRIS